MADGSITFSTALDNKELEKELQSVTKKINSLEEKVAQKQSEKMPLVSQAKELGAELDAAKAKLYEMQNAARGTYSADEIKEQKVHVNGLQSEWNSVQGRVERYDTAINNATIELDRSKEKAGAISKELAEAGYNADAMNKATKRANGSMGRFALRVREVVRSALVFTLITQALAKFREWVGKVIKTNTEASAAIARLKGALLTLAQPLVNVIIPAFTAFVNVLTQIVAAIASVMSTLFGTTIEQSAAAAESLNNETTAIQGVGASAKKASKQLAAFDEINKLSGEDSGSGGAGAGSEIAPDFGYVKKYGDRLQEIAKAVMLIGAGLALWKISSILPEQLGNVAKTLAGIAIAVGGLIIMWGGLKDAWENGIDWGNLAQMLLGAAIAVGGLYLAFGKLGAAIGLIVTGLAVFVTGIKDAFENGVNWQNLISILAGATAAVIGLYLAFGKIGAGIGLVVTGITMLITGFRDVMENGANLQNTLLIIAGIVATGLGISLLTKSLLPALVAGVLAVIYAFVAWQGNAEELAENLKLILAGIIDFLTGVFTGDWEKAWNGLKDVFRGIINSVLIIFESVINGVITGLNFLIAKINTLHWDIPEWVPGIGGESFGFSINPIQKVTLPRIPKLAQGAVIPPNREFMAILGDQKSGTNIEAPAELIEQMVVSGLKKAGFFGAGAAQGDITIIMEMDKQQFGKVVYKANKRESRRVGVSLVEV